MADISYGTGGGNLDDLVRRAQAAAQASDELRRKEEERASVEERTSAADEVQERVRADVGQATRELTSSLDQNTSALLAETGAVQANTAAWVRNAEARAAAVAAGNRGGLVAAAASVESAATAPVSNLESANAVLTARRQVAEAAAQAAQVAEINRAAATVSREPVRLPLSAVRTAAGAEGVAQAVAASERPAALFQTTAAQAEALRAASARQSAAVSGAGAVQGAVEGPAQQAAAQDAQAMQQRIAAARQAAVAEEELQAREAAHTNLLSTLAQRQREVTLGVNQASAAYAESANVLQRHGALTSEFIAAFARGDVTLAEFGDQMVATIGKFSGWAVAGAAVYGAFRALKDLKDGATETQSAVSQLGRFIPGLGGPAGGGTGQVSAAESTVRSISTQFNVPISEVTSAMSVMARTFNNVTDAGEATRAVLAAVRLDQVPEGQATQYLTGIAQALDFTKGSQLTGVIDSLNELQYRYGARVSQTLPGVARAAPAALAGGLDIPALESMTALGVRAGLTGNQVGTAITRSITSFAFSGGSEIAFRRLGINPVAGQYGDLIRQVADVIDTRGKAGTLTGGDLRNLAVALGGPQQSRVFLPLLAQEAERPGALRTLIGATEHPRPYEQDLSAVLNTVTERFRSIGITLQNFGSRLAQIGTFQPLIGALDVIRDLVGAIEMVTNPLVQLGGLFNRLPGPLRDLIAIAIAARAGRALYNTSFGSNVQGFLGRLPVLNALDSTPRQQVRTTLSRLRTSVLPDAERQESRADAGLVQARLRLQSALERQAAAEEAARAAFRTSGAGSAEYERAQNVAAAAQDEVASATRAEAAAAQRAMDSGAHVAQVKADISVLNDRHVETETKIQYMLERQLLVTTESVNVQEQYLDAARATVARLRGGGGAAAAGGAEAAVAAAGAARAPQSAAAEDIARAAAIAGSTAVVEATASTLAGSGSAAQDLVFMQQSMRAAAGTGAPGVTPTAAIGGAAAAAERSVPESLSTMQALRMTVFGGVNVGRPGEIADRISAAGDSVTSRLSRISPAAATNAALFAGIFATQAAGGIGGGVGNFISNVGGQTVTGALLASMLGRGGVAGIGAGAALGTVAGSFAAGGTSQGLHSALGAGIGTAIGAGLGALGGPLDFLSVPAGAVIGANIGGVVGSLFGRPEDPNKASQKQLSRFAALAQAGDVSGLQDDFLTQLQTAYSGSGSGQSRAQTSVSQYVQRLQSELQLFGPNTPEGQTATTGLQAVVGAAIQQAPTDPATAAQVLQTVSARQQFIQSQFQASLATAAPGAGVATAQQSIGQYQTLYNAVYGHALSDAQSKQQDQQRFYDQTRRRLGVTPQQASRVVDLTRARTAAAAAQETFSKSLSDEGWTDKTTGAQVAADAAQARYRQLQAADRGSNLTAAQQTKLEAARGMLDQANAGLRAAQEAIPAAQRANEALKQQTYAAGYQQDQQTLQAQGALAVAQAGGNRGQALAAQLSTQRQALRNAQAATPLGAVAQANEIAKAQTDIANTHTQITQQGLTELQARGQVAAARVPVGDPVQQSRVALTNATQAWEYMKRNANAFDPSQISQALAAVISARQAVSQAVVQYQTQMNDLSGQIAQAHEFGDQVAQAATGLSTAQRDLVIAQRHGTPQQRRAAQLEVVNAQNQQQQANFDRIAQRAATTSAQEFGDPVAQARTMVQAAQRQLAMARGFDEQNQALANLASAQAQLHQALLSNIQAAGQLQETLQTGDTVAQAQTAMRTAAALLANAHGQAETVQAEQAMASAQVQYRQALENRYIAQGALQASTTNDPLQQLRDQMAATARALSVARGPDERAGFQTTLNSQKLQYQNTLVSQREGTIQFQLDMQQITTQQAINQLQGLLKLKNLSVTQRQDILSRIHQLQVSDTQSGQFDLAPSGGNVGLPTVYDVHSLMRNGQIRAHPLVAAAHDASTTNINVLVRNGNDVAAVTEAIERATGAKLKARLRAAGVRGV